MTYKEFRMIVTLRYDWQVLDFLNKIYNKVEYHTNMVGKTVLIYPFSLPPPPVISAAMVGKDGL